MNQQKIDIFEYEKEIKKLPEEWMEDMAIVFREFDENKDGKITGLVAEHIFLLFRLPSNKIWKKDEIVSFKSFILEAQNIRDDIFLNPDKRYKYYFQMIAGLGKNTIDAADIQRFIEISGDHIDLKYCDDFIDEFDRETLSKDSITQEEFCDFCSQKKIPV
ncbi:hypothetical protein M9Y10_035145 [Tritrichomonas musculus]|uniref:EF-hand domain-containing protein n=1 Tax=Tritrichomonas musculus TaxID=1915356 RepID=A0ABR2KGW2_9EUKA